MIGGESVKVHAVHQLKVDSSGLIESWTAYVVASCLHDNLSLVMVINIFSLHFLSYPWSSERQLSPACPDLEP